MDKKKQGGYTFIELLIAVTIISLLGGAVYSTFIQGGKLWLRANREDPEIIVGIFFEKVAFDLRNAFQYSSMPFIGKGAETVFFSVLEPEVTNSGLPAQTARIPTRVRYVYNEKAKTIEREMRNYDRMLYSETAFQDVAKTVLDHISRYQVLYYEVDPKSKMIYWKQTWNRDCVPRSLKISLNYTRENKIKSVFEKVLPVPAGNCAEK